MTGVARIVRDAASRLGRRLSGRPGRVRSAWGAEEFYTAAVDGADEFARFCAEVGADDGAAWREALFMPVVVAARTPLSVADGGPAALAGRCRDYLAGRALLSLEPGPRWVTVNGALAVACLDSGQRQQLVTSLQRSPLAFWSRLEPPIPVDPPRLATHLFTVCLAAEAGWEGVRDAYDDWGPEYLSLPRGGAVPLPQPATVEAIAATWKKALARAGR